MVTLSAYASEGDPPRDFIDRFPKGNRHTSRRQICSYCKLLGHTRQQCYQLLNQQKQESQQQELGTRRPLSLQRKIKSFDRDALKCYFCGQSGHIIRTCPKYSDAKRKAQQTTKSVMFLEEQDPKN